MKATKAYHLHEDGHLCEGWSYGPGFDEYLRTRVKDRCTGKDLERTHAVGGFDSTHIDEILSTEPPVESWKIGECVAECFLEDDKSARLPNPRLVQKNPKASTAGPDLAGLSTEGVFLFGEVKTTGASGSPRIVKRMTEQLENILESKSTRRSLIRWIMYMARKSEWEKDADKALSEYLDGKYMVVGVLVRDTKPQKADLDSEFSRIQKRTAVGVLLALYALYLPVAVGQMDLVKSNG